MKIRLPLIVVAVAAFVMLCITSKNSVSVTFNGASATANCTSIDRPTTRRARRSITRPSNYKFRFTDHDGQVRNATIRYGAFWIRPKVGDSVPIVYVKNSPDVIYYDSVFHVWMFPAIFASVLIALAIKLVIRRPSKTEE